MKSKIIIFIILILSVINSMAQDPLIYESIIRLDTVTDEKELLKRLKIWLDEAFVNDKEVIQIMDEEQGQVIGKGSIKYVSNIYMGSAGTSGYVNFKMKIEIKKGRYRYEFYDFNHAGTEPMAANFGLLTTDTICPVMQKGNPVKWTNRVWNDIREQTEAKMELVVSSLIQYMATLTISESKDW